jgi:uncharacterized protein (DUF58 family)
MSELLDAKILGAIAGKVWKTAGRAEGAVAGRHASRHTGQSLEFSQHRSYAAGDDLKHIDWKLFARNERFFVKQFRAETNVRAYITLDASASMAFPAEAQNNRSEKRLAKFDYAKKIAAAAAYVLAAQGDAVGFCVAKREGGIFLPAAGGWGRFEEIMNILETAEAEGRCGLSGAADSMAAKMKKRSLFLLISDLLEDRGEILAAIKRLSSMRHECRLIHILDRSETFLDVDAPTTVTDSETLESVEIDPDAAKNYRAAMEAEISFWRTSLGKHSVAYDLFFTDEAPEKNIARLLA